MIPIYKYSFQDIYSNVALDEVLFIEGKLSPKPTIRVWEQPETAIVLGRSQLISKEVNTETCTQDNISICRRCSAGGTVIQKTGSLNFVFSFPISWNACLTDVRKSFQYFAEFIMDALAINGIQTGYRLLSDITDGNDKKLSGNAQSRNPKNIMHHGTLLAQNCSQEMEKYLLHPSTEPEYRGTRSHQKFVTSLQELGFSLTLDDLAVLLHKIFPYSEIIDELPENLTTKAKQLVEEKYKHNIWNLEGKKP